MEAATRRALVDRLERFDPIVELAIGRRPSVASALAESNDVIATDRVERPVPEPVTFVRDDLTDPTRSVYTPARGLYAINFPGELHRPALELARDTDSSLAFTTLGHESPVVPVQRRETLPGETLYWVCE